MTPIPSVIPSDWGFKASFDSAKHGAATRRSHWFAMVDKRLGAENRSQVPRKPSFLQCWTGSELHIHLMDGSEMGAQENEN